LSDSPSDARSDTPQSCQYYSKVGQELVASDKSARKNVSANQVMQRGSIPIGHLDEETTALWHSFNTTEHPHTLNTLTPMIFPFSKLGFINLHNNAWTANSVMMENHHFPQSFDAQTASNW